MYKLGPVINSASNMIGRAVAKSVKLEQLLIE